MTSNIKTSKRALSLVEMMVAMMVLMVALPPLIDAAMSMARWDRTRDLRSHATHFGQLALERTHYQLYDDETRSWTLDDPVATRVTKYSTIPPTWMQPLAYPAGAVVNAPAKAGANPAPAFGAIYQREGGPATGLTETTHPELVADVASYRVQLTVTPIDASTLPAFPNKNEDDPRPDLAQVEVLVRWTDFRGGTREQRVRSWRTRPVWEPDPRLVRTTGP
jgi:hypothetical protein